MGEAALVGREDHGAVAVLLIGAAPGNVLSAAVVDALQGALRGALAEATVGAVLIRGLGRSFPLDTNFAETDAPAPEGALAALCERIEAGGKPVVVALHGSVLGAALALALAAHARIAVATTQFGFPEVTLGLMPTAGATQRAPRLIGGEQALRLMLTGRPVGAAEALALGLLDQVVEDGLAAAALAMAQGCAGGRLTASRDRGEGLRDGGGFQRAVALARGRAAAGRLPAPRRIVDCIEAAQLLPFTAGLDFEAAAAAELRASPESAGLRHVYLAERRAAHFPELELAGVSAPRPVQRLGILGTLADDLVLPALTAGMEMILVDADRHALVQSLERIAGAQQKAVADGRLTAAQRDADWGRLGTVSDPAALGGCDAVILGAPEHLPAALAATAPGVLLGLSLPGEVPPEVVPAARVADVLGFHPGGNRFVEIAVHPATAPGQVLAALALARAIGCTALRTLAPGGVAARLMATGRAAVAWVLAEGESPAAVAGALSGFGLSTLMPQGVRPEVLPAPKAERIVQRVVAGMANEGARILSEGLVARPSDIDLAVVSGAGFPRWQGGPMHWADRRGLLILRRDLLLWAWEAPELWTMDPLVADLVAQGRHFAELDAG